MINRKNFLFTNSVTGAETAAGYMTLLRSAQINGLNPWKYLEYVLSRMKYYKDKEAPEEVVNSLLPYSKELPAFLQAGYREDKPAEETEDK